MIALLTEKGAIMAIRFFLSADDDLIWDIDDHSDPLSEEQARLVALRQMAVSLGALAGGLERIASAIEARAGSAAAQPRKPKVAAKRKSRR
jgi:hypothetical protein